MEKESSEISQGRQIESETSNNTEMDSNTLASGNETNQEYNLAKETNKMDDNVVKEESNQYSKHDENLIKGISWILGSTKINLKSILDLDYTNIQSIFSETLIIFIRKYYYDASEFAKVNMCEEALVMRAQRLITYKLKNYPYLSQQFDDITGDIICNLLECIKNPQITFWEKNFKFAMDRLISNSIRKRRIERKITPESIDKYQEVIAVHHHFDDSLFNEYLYSRLEAVLSSAELLALEYKLEKMTARTASEKMNLTESRYNNLIRAAIKKLRKIGSDIYYKENIL